MDKEARPRLTNDEEDLIQMQEDFLAGRIQKSSIEIIKAPRPSTTSANPPVKKQSLFAQRREATEKESKQPTQIENPLVRVLGDIVEKCDLPSNLNPRPPVSTSFPEVIRLDKSIANSTSSSRGCSIFARQVKNNLSKDEALEEESSSSRTSTASFGECSRIVRAVLGETDAAKIHEENLQRLASMSEEEIKKEREQLMQNLDPKLLALLKRKQNSSSSITPTIQKVTVEPMEEDVEEVVEEVRELKKAKYVHMDVVEKDKVRWMTPLPPPIKTPKSGEYFQARFDFEGNLLLADADLPVTTALYNHGEEPERAGYSINELMLLSRSSTLQQRVFAINTISKVLELARLGRFDTCFQEPLIPTLLNSGLLLLLRFCLDDKNSAVVSASMVALSRLLSSPLDETCLDRSLLLWRRGEEQPDLSSRVQTDPADKEQEAEMKDNEMERIDVARACLRMDVPRRIRYVLEEMRPPEARTVLSALEVLTRLARSSPAVAQSLLDTPRLMNTLLSCFLPSTWPALSRAESTQTDRILDNLYDRPVRQVLRLARVIVSWNRDLAVRLMAEYPQFLEAVKLYIMHETALLDVPTQEGLQLVLDSYHLWRTLLRHGVGVQAFVDYQPAWVPQLLECRTSISVLPESGRGTDNIRFSHQLGTAMLLMIEALLGVCQIGPSVPEPFDCGQVAGLRELVEQCVAKWSNEFRQLSFSSAESASGLLAAALEFLATFYAHWTHHDVSSAVPLLDQLCTLHILPLLSSPALAGCTVATFASHSNLINPSGLKVCRSRDPEALPSVNSVAERVHSLPILTPPVPFPLPAAIFRLLRLWKAKSQSAQEVQLNLSDCYFDYLEKVSRSAQKSELADNWFTRYELQFVHQLLMFCAECWSQIPADPRKKTIIHQAALTTLSYLPVGEESAAADWMRRIVFHPDFMTSTPHLMDEMESALDRLHISERSDEHQSLLDKTLKELDQIAEFYVQHLFPSSGENDSALQSLVRKGERILPTDWMYLPLVALYQRDYENPSTSKSNSVPDVTVALRTLQAVHILAELRPTWFHSRSNIQPEEHYARLACVFLSNNALFFELEVADHLSPILRRIASQTFNFGQPISGVDDFTVFFDGLVEQFEAVSYGNPLFAAFLFMPMKQTQPVVLRRKLWCDHPDALRILTLSEQLMLSPLEHWLEPIEKDEVLRMKYAAHLRSGAITIQRNPVLWKIASHHSESKV